MLGELTLADLKKIPYTRIFRITFSCSFTDQNINEKHLAEDMRFGIHYFAYMKYSYHCSVSLEQSRSIDHSNWSFNNLFISSKNDKSAHIHGQKK